MKTTVNNVLPKTVAIIQHIILIYLLQLKNVAEKQYTMCFSGLYKTSKHMVHPKFIIRLSGV